MSGFFIKLFFLCAGFCLPFIVSAAPMDVVVGILPQKFIAEQIGGKNINVSVMVPPGKDPHSYELSPKQVEELAKAKLYFSIGMPFETAIVEKIKKMGLKTLICDSAAGIKRIDMEKHLAGHIEIEHSKEAGHHHDDDDDCEGPDPHIWLSIKNVKTMAANIQKVLEKADPANADSYKENLAKFDKSADEIDAGIKKNIEPYKGSAFFVYHPAFGYFADDYGLKQYAIEIEGKSPAPKEIERLIKEAKTRGVKIIFVQPQLDRKAAQAVASAIGGTVLPMDDLDENIFENMKNISAGLKKSVSGAK